MRIRNQELHILFTPEEIARIRQRMEDAGVQNRSAFIRKMTLDGYIVKLDTSDIREMITLLRRCSNNLNQVAKRANATGSIYETDIEELKKQHDEIWELARQILARLSTIQ